MTKGELILLRARAPGPIRLKGGQVLFGQVTAYHHAESDDSATIEITPTLGEPVRVRVEEIDAE